MHLPNAILAIHDAIRELARLKQLNVASLEGMAVGAVGGIHV